MLHVVLVETLGHGGHVDLVNNGVTTVRDLCFMGEKTTILQTRSAFRGMVNALTDLHIFQLERAEEGGVDDNEEGGEE